MMEQDMDTMWFEFQKKLAKSPSDSKIGAQSQRFPTDNSTYHYALNHPKSYPDTVGENFLTPPWPNSDEFLSQIGVWNTFLTSVIPDIYAIERFKNVSENDQGGARTKSPTVSG